MRIISDNAANRAAITVANTAPELGAANLLTDIKGQVCRVLGKSATVTLTWPALETVGGVVIPASNLGPSTTIRVRAYSDEEGLNLVTDTGDKWAAPGPIFSNEDFTQPLNVNNFTQPLNVNSFAFSSPPITQVYFQQQEVVRRVVIEIAGQDADYIDMSRLIVGRYFQTKINASYGQQDSVIDLSTNSRAASGDIKTDFGPVAKRMTFDLQAVEETDRARVLRTFQSGVGRWIFISLVPEHVDAELERDKSIYGKLSAPGTMSWTYFAHHSSSFEIEGF